MPTDSFFPTLSWQFSDFIPNALTAIAVCAALVWLQTRLVRSASAFLRRAELATDSCYWRVEGNRRPSRVRHACEEHC